MAGLPAARPLLAAGRQASALEGLAAILGSGLPACVAATARSARTTDPIPRGGLT